MIFNANELTTGRRVPSEIVSEYEHKRSLIPQALKDFTQASLDLKSAATIGGTWGQVNIDTGHIYESILEKSLLQSAWRHIYTTYGLEEIATADSKRRYEHMFSDPPEFNIDNIRNVFGELISDPWGNILKGLAEVFSSLDPVFRSHEKMKIGVKGLPKRVIISNISEYGSWGRDRLRDILNALAAYQHKPLTTYQEISELLSNENAMQESRGVRLKRYANGNGHLFFEPESLRDINKALSEYYGEVLPDCPESRPKKQTSREVSKDLQFYQTPQAVIDRVLGDLVLTDKNVLEPSCGNGVFMDAIRSMGGNVFGIEVDFGRAQQALAKGHNVMIANFLETAPVADYDFVIMNPPFYGRHYAKHIHHAMKFLKPNGTLISILPSTARYDHDELDEYNTYWYDLPVGSFSESGTNVNTSIVRIRNEDSFARW